MSPRLASLHSLCPGTVLIDSSSSAPHTVPVPARLDPRKALTSDRHTVAELPASPRSSL